MKKTLRGIAMVMGLPVMCVVMTVICVFTDVYFNIKNRFMDWTMIKDLPHYFPIMAKVLWHWVKTGVLDWRVV